VQFKQGLFNMSSDSHLFRTRAELEKEGYRLVGNRFVKEASGEQRVASSEKASREQRVASCKEASGERRVASSNSPLATRDSLLANSATRHSSLANTYLPLYEAKMIWHYDHRYGTYEGADSRSGTQLPTPDGRQHADPQFVVQPWYWVPAEEVAARLGDWQRGWLLGFRDVTNATNERTAIFSLLPRVGVGNNLPILLCQESNHVLVCCLLCNLNTQVFDYVTRQKIAGVHMNFFLVSQLPVLPPAAYTPEDLRFIVPRVLELTYTAWDMQPFADDVWQEADEALRAAIRTQWEANRREANGEWRVASGREASSEQRVASCKEASGERRVASSNSPLATRDSLLANSATRHSPLANSATRHSPLASEPLAPFIWNAARRAQIRAELDAYYARLYGLTRKQLRYILDPADLTERELEDILDPWEDVADPLDPAAYAKRLEQSTFPGETFRVLKEKEIRQFGEYRTRRLVLEAWARLTGSRNG
jgi:hypothetical protein